MSPHLLLAAIIAILPPPPTDNGFRIGVEGALPVHRQISLGFAGTEVTLAAKAPWGRAQVEVYASVLDRSGAPDPAETFVLWETRLQRPGRVSQSFLIPDWLTTGGLLLQGRLRNDDGRILLSAPIYIVFAEPPCCLVSVATAPLGTFPATLTVPSDG
jgi:hypothetical protein